MTRSEFNDKWQGRIEKGFETQGCMLNDPDEIIRFDNIFEKYKVEYPNFKFSQIKKKFGETVLYTSGIYK